MPTDHDWMIDDTNVSLLFRIFKKHCMEYRHAYLNVDHHFNQLLLPAMKGLDAGQLSESEFSASCTRPFVQSLFVINYDSRTAKCANVIVTANSEWKRPDYVVEIYQQSIRQ
ncbi:hypothetical protein BCR42DRAFT_427171 [Absidia repens]|uniref:Uncharacterized protein n=1 Tax=Absidia repens TaxID=90262 RepID=A0A1X2I000_9FUNG|nr:hypothetical protein BCR42DRAFT_427171 [Absidia repens]